MFEVLNIPTTSNRYASLRPAQVLLRLDDPNEDFIFAKDVTTSSPKSTRLCDVFDLVKYRDKFIEYCYDFGDNWEHSVTLVGRAEEGASNGVIVCLDGGGGSVAEDCGSTDGWEGLKEIYRRRKDGGSELSTEELERLEHYECGRDLDPWNWDKDYVNERLADIDEEIRTYEMFMSNPWDDPYHSE
jgi:Plasmid pRiA4b ORF-3-like protein